MSAICFSTRVSLRHLSSMFVFLSFSVFTARCYASAVLAMGLCLSVSVSVSVSPSVTSRSSTKTAKSRITQTTPHDTSGTLAFSAKFDRGHPLWGRRLQVGWVKIVDFPQITGYISISRKRYKIDAWFLLKSNRKSYALYRMVTLPMTLGAP